MFWCLNSQQLKPTVFRDLFLTYLDKIVYILISVSAKFLISGDPYFSVMSCYFILEGLTNSEKSPGLLIVGKKCPLIFNWLA